MTGTQPDVALIVDYLLFLENFWWRLDALSVTSEHCKILADLVETELHRTRYQISLGFTVTRIEPRLEGLFYMFISKDKPKYILPSSDPQYKGQVH